MKVIISAQRAVSVTADSGASIPYAELRRLEGSRPGRPGHQPPQNVAQPVTLTDPGRAAPLAAGQVPYRRSSSAGCVQ